MFDLKKPVAKVFESFIQVSAILFVRIRFPGQKNNKKLILIINLKVSEVRWW